MARNLSALRRGSLFAATALLAALPALAQESAPPAAAPAHDMQHCKMMGSATADPGGDHASPMMAMHTDAKAKMDAMDAKLSTLVMQMDAAKGTKKVDAMAAVLDELVAQRKAMREMMETMQPMMVRHMVSQMGMGMMRGMMEGMSCADGDCPNMKMGGGDGHPGMAEGHHGAMMGGKDCPMKDGKDCPMKDGKDCPMKDGKDCPHMEGKDHPAMEMKDCPMHDAKSGAQSGSAQPEGVEKH
jgi:hypothetical protein